VKKILFAVMLVAVFSFAAMAQNAKAPMLSANHGNSAVHKGGSFEPAGAPALCQGRCPFYGGDIDTNDPGANGFVNSNTVFVGDSHTYQALTAPINAMVTGILVNSTPFPPQGGNPYDPAIGVWDVRTGVSSGNGGTSVASGQNALHHLATGRVLPWGNEDSIGSLLTSPVSIAKGTTYWFNYTPQCTNSSNPDCTGGYFFESNTDGLNGVKATLQPKYQSFLNSSYFGYVYANWCDVLGTGQTSSCQGMSYALAGHQ
jgi:hypothetical protein